MHKEFWDALLVIAEVELQEAVKQDELDWARLRGEAIPAKYTVKEAGLHEAVDSDVQMMLAGGWIVQLIVLHFCCLAHALQAQDIVLCMNVLDHAVLCVFVARRVLFWGPVMGQTEPHSA